MILKYSLLILIISCVVFGDDVFSAMVSLEQLLPTEEALVFSLQSYIFAEEQKLQKIKNIVDQLRIQNDLARKDKVSFFANPINAYLLIKRLSVDWRDIKHLLHSNPPQNVYDFVAKDSLILPTDEDYLGAVEALHRLQTTYRLESSSLARGEINGVKYTSEMSSHDCFAIGTHIYGNSNFIEAKQWFLESLKRLSHDSDPRLRVQDILEPLSWTYYQLGNLTKAVECNSRITNLEPRHPRAWRMKKLYANKTAFQQNEIERKRHESHPHRTTYEELCRGEAKISEDIRSQLKCYYYQPAQNMFLKIAPFKMEEVYKTPLIRIFYDIMSDREINVIKQLAIPKLTRAQVVHGENSSALSNHRVGKLAWLEDREYDFLGINKRLEDISGLTLKTSENLQVLNYGIGGYYNTHHDFFVEQKFMVDGITFNRIATILIYMSDVEQGGATVFPRLGISVKPKKGSLVLWYNLHSDLTPDNMTYHAACPVLQGYKWVANRWIHDYGQVFKRPCEKKLR